MNYSNTNIKKYYDEFGDAETNRLVSTPTDEISLEIHNSFIEKHIPSNKKLLEIGAGTGRFTRRLSKDCSWLTVSDISDVQLNLNKKYSKEQGYYDSVSEWCLTDIVDLSKFEDGSFDAVIGYGGPLSYALDQRNIALLELKRVLKPGGILLLSVMSLWGSIHRNLKGVLSVPMSSNKAIIKSGDVLPESIDNRNGHYMHLYRASELRQDIKSSGFDVLEMSSSNFLSVGRGDEIANIRGDKIKWKEFVKWELEACTELGALDTGTHILVVAKKI
jgi:ubiquinone/menaquinone biosynthesis C-methylase UbiE